MLNSKTGLAGLRRWWSITLTVPPTNLCSREFRTRSQAALENFVGPFDPVALPDLTEVALASACRMVGSNWRELLAATVTLTPIDCARNCAHPTHRSVAQHCSRIDLHSVEVFDNSQQSGMVSKGCAQC